MKFEEFDMLARGSRPWLLLAMDLLMENGRKSIQSTDQTELASQLRSDAGNFIVGNMLAEIVDTAKKLAQLRTCKLLEYVKRSGLEFERPGAPEPGVCPVCGADIEYNDTMLFEDEDYTMWRCPDCGAAGKAVYKKEFHRYSDVIDGDGKPFIIPAQ